MNLYKTDSVVLNLDAFVRMEKSVVCNDSAGFLQGITYFTERGYSILVFESEEERDNVFNNIFLQLQLLGG